MLRLLNPTRPCPTLKAAKQGMTLTIGKSTDKDKSKGSIDKAQTNEAEAKMTDQGVAMFSNTENEDSFTPVEFDVVQTVASRVAESFLDKGGSALEVVDGFSSLPQETQDYITEHGGDNGVDGVFHNGVAYVVADKMRSEDHVVETVFHELYGHYGARLFYSKGGYKKALNQLWVATGGWKGVQGLAKKYEIALDSYIQDYHNQNRKKSPAGTPKFID
jgi:hypothetical protein